MGEIIGLYILTYTKILGLAVKFSFRDLMNLLLSNIPLFLLLIRDVFLLSKNCLCSKLGAGNALNDNFNSVSTNSNAFLEIFV